MSTKAIEHLKQELETALEAEKARTADVQANRQQLEQARNDLARFQKNPESADTEAVRTWIKSRRDLTQIFRYATEQDQRQIKELAEQLQLDSLLVEVLAESDEIA